MTQFHITTNGIKRDDEEQNFIPKNFLTKRYWIYEKLLKMASMQNNK